MADEKSLQAVSSEAKVDKCPDCGCEEIEKKGDERFCKKCGLVID